MASTTAAFDVFPSVSHSINIKLESSNYSLWLAQLLPVLKSRQLMSFVDGSSECPSEFLTDDKDKATSTVNPKHAECDQKDQFVLSWITGYLGHQALAAAAR